MWPVALWGIHRHKNPSAQIRPSYHPHVTLHDPRPLSGPQCPTPHAPLSDLFHPFAGHKDLIDYRVTWDFIFRY